MSQIQETMDRVQSRQDITNTRYYYAKINDEWLIVDMQSVTE